MNTPEELKYTKEHEWVLVEGNIATIGITDYAQGELGDIVFIELPTVGDEIKSMETLGTIEAVKAVSDMFAPLTGKVTEVNSVLEDDPAVINSDPYGAGWMVKMEIVDAGELTQLLDAAAYSKLTE